MALSPVSELAPRPSAAVGASSFVNCSVVGPSSRGGALSTYRVGLTVDSCTFLGGGATASSTAEEADSAVCEETHSQVSLEAGLGGAIYTAQSQVAISGTSVEGSAAAAGGALFAAGSQVILTGVQFRNNTALRGGALLASGSSASASASSFEDNAAAFGGAVMLVDSGSFVLSSSDASGNYASGTGGAFFLGAATNFTAFGSVIARNRAVLSGGVAFAQSPKARPILGHNNTLEANTADNWGPLDATDSYTVSVSVPPSVRPGDPLSAFVTVQDGYGQPVSLLRDSSIVVSLPADPAALKSPFVHSYSSPRSPVAGLSLRGREGLNYSLVFTVTAPDLPGPIAAVANITVARCGFFEEFDPASAVCDCVAGSERGADGFCQCPDRFYAFTSGFDADGFARAICRPCPAVGAVCTNGLMVPQEGYWHSSPESADIQACLLESACKSVRGSGRTAALLAFQRAALAGAQHSLTLSGLALAGKLDVEDYKQLQCAEGYTGPICGSCAAGYGRRQLMECRKCPPKSQNDGELKRRRLQRVSL